MKDNGSRDGKEGGDVLVKEDVSVSSMQINAESIRALLSLYRDDPEMTETVEHALVSFETYHKAIYDLEIKKRMHACGAMDSETYRELIPALDKTRTFAHNALLTDVNLLNRMAAAAGIPPVYEGTVSEERPYRREVADAVLAFVRQIIVDRD